MGGLVRCVACGEVHWNLRFAANHTPVSHCRVCGEELREERPEARRFGRIAVEQRDAPPSTGTAGLGGGAVT
jgi:hypothetical protein